MASAGCYELHAQDPKSFVEGLNFLMYQIAMKQKKEKNTKYILVYRQHLPIAFCSSSMFRASTNYRMVCPSSVGSRGERTR